jgi:simple sugar transport system permease protein
MTTAPARPGLFANFMQMPVIRIVPLGLWQSVGAIALGIAICLLIILGIADEPLKAFGAFTLGTFVTPYAFGSMLAVATVLVLTALAASVAFRAGAFNIGTEGQLVLGGLAAAVVAPMVGAPGIAQIVALLAAALVGALWVAIPAWLRVRYRTNEILSTLMFNYIAADLALFLVNSYFRDVTSGAVETPPLDPSLWLPRLMKTSAANVGLFLSILVAAGLWVLFERTRVGKRMEATGLQPAFAEYLGIKSGRYLMWSLLGSGALAGLGGGIAVLGIAHAYQSGFSPQYGFLGITVALIGRLRPLGIILAAVLYSSLITGASVMQSATDVPFSLVFILQGVLILLITSRRGGAS